MAAPAKKSVLFICLGNICRSPIAEAVFRKLVDEKGLSDKWVIDSAGVANYHIGSSPDSRAISCLSSHNISTTHKCRQLAKGDFTKFDVIFGMDDENMDDLDDMAPSGSTAQLKRLGEYDPEKQLTIRDPYYGSQEDFEKVYVQCVRCCKGFLESQSY